MADKNLQFLDIPRADPAKTAVETRVTNFNEIYAHFEPQGAAQQARPLPGARQSVMRVEMSRSQLHPELAEADPGRQPV